MSLQYAGDLAAIEDLGFQTVWREEEGRAVGTVAMADLERIAVHAGVVRMSLGREPKPTLDQSIPDIKANQVWSRAGSTFAGTTGRNVIVGIIDTGIDIHHPFFRSTTPTKATRILRLWDPGLVPQGGETSPDAALLSAPGSTYGVEYNAAQINAALGNVAEVRHRDCNGHGTHVASIAAGNGQDDFQYVGVAPEADLVVVKYLYLQTPPEVGGVPVPYDKIFRDAVTYILKVARDVFARPVVINCSFGSDLGPHDGFTDDEDFLTHTFANAPAGQHLVHAAGNDAGSRQHARIEFPVGGGTADIPIELYDTRTQREKFNKCRWEDPTSNLSLQLYYPAGGAAITVELDIPDDGAGFIPGPARPGANSGTAGGRGWEMQHAEETIVLRAGRGTVMRSRFEIELEPNARKEHLVGSYALRVSAPSALTVHLWCQQAFGYGLTIGPGAGPPGVVNVEDRFQIGDNGGADKIITVAAFDAETAGLPTARFSSRGPLADYGGAPAQPLKPDLGAPGVGIDAARSRDQQPKRKKTGTDRKGGTSMAAPHVAGAVALLLQKNPTLTVSDVLTTLKSNIRDVPPPDPVELGAGRLDVKDAIDHTPAP